MKRYLMIVPCVMLLPGRWATPAHAVASTGTWAPTSSMSTPRDFTTAILLNNGLVLVAGGLDATTNSALASAELYDSSTGTWSPTGSMTAPNTSATATLLLNGKVLVAGGNPELYDPSTGTWSATGSMTYPRVHATATLLLNGLVLVAGGGNAGGPLDTSEIYDPSTGTWSLTGLMTASRENATATLLPGTGFVLVAGGLSNGGSGSGPVASAELYNPASRSWSATGSMSTPRVVATATLLHEGDQILVAGGGSNSAELYTPATGTWSPTGSMSTSRVGGTIVLLPNGHALVAGGRALASAELYLPPAPDTTAPVLSLPSTIAANATSSSGAVVNYTVTATDPDDASNTLTITCIPSSGSTFPIGTTTVQCSASDPAGNTSSGSFQVIVQDTQPPVLSLPGTITVNATSSAGAVVNYTVTASDPIYPASALTITCTPPSGSTFPVGTTTVQCSASDPAGNSATGSFQVIVQGQSASDQIDVLIALVKSFHLKPIIQNTLVAELKLASSELGKNHPNAACTLLDVFSTEVQIATGHGITTAQANQLLAAAEQIEAVLGCS